MTAPAKFEPDRVTDSGRPSATPNVGGLAIRRNGASPGPPMAGLARRSGPERVPADGSDAIAAQSQPGATLPSTLRAMVRRASGVATDDVRVHYNSPEPAQLNALAYTQGSEIHLGPGQEHALGHEVTHVVQQKQGRVRPTTTVHGLAINDDAALEQEADGAQLGRPAGPVVPATEALQLLKAKIPGSAPNAVVTVADVRARLALFRAQVEEYRNYPDEVAAADGAVLASVEQRVDRAQVLFGEIVRDLPLADGAQITAAAVRGHYGDTAKLTELGGCLKDTRAAINARYDAWETWHYTNPDSLAELDATTVKTGAELGLAGEEGVRYGKYDGGGIFKVIGDALPQPADRDAADRLRKRLVQDGQVAQLRADVDGMNMLHPAAAMRGELHGSPSEGAKAMRAKLLAGGDLTITRVMGDGEADAVGAARGDLLRKDAAAKWVTIGAVANINAIGDVAHQRTVQWVVRADFRNVLLKQGMNYYNENVDNARDYVEPYWVWKDAEGANLAFSPVLVPIFNSMIVSVHIDNVRVAR